jgi:hypothetical protein
MLTLFSIPKPFTGAIARLQRNAVRSWRALSPAVEIILLGEDAGVAEIAREAGAIHIRGVARTEWGAPRVDDVFRRAETAAHHDLLCYINTDIILLADFLGSIRRAADLTGPFLVIGQRWDLGLEEEIDFQESRWEDRIRALLREGGRLHSPAAVDYFVFRKGLWPSIPPFGVGRTAWDNWLVLEARRRGAMVVDATGGICAVHQTHDYAHHPQGYDGVWAGPEAEHNADLSGRPEYNFSVEDATHILTGNGIRPDLRPVKLKRHFSTLMVLWPSTAPVVKGIRWLYKLPARIKGRLFRGPNSNRRENVREEPPGTT